MASLLNQNFKSKRERNSYAFENKSSLVLGLEQNKNFSLEAGISWGLLLGIILGVISWSWLMFFVGLIGFPLLLRGFKVYQVRKVGKYASEYENFLNRTEELVKDILCQFNKRYFTAEQKLQHVSDLVNFINYKKNLSLTERAGEYILVQNEKENNINEFDNEISKLENKSADNLAKILIKSSPETNFENEGDCSGLLEHFCECLERKDIEYNVDEIKQELLSEFKLIKATQFEEKLFRNFDKRIAVDEIEHLNGFEFEELIGELFRKAGYKAEVTKKSGDQGADLVVEKDGVSTAIQTKKYAGSVGNTAVQEVVAAMKYYDCDKAMVITTGLFTKGAFELAGRNGVRLVDKKGLDDLFDSIL